MTITLRPEHEKVIAQAIESALEALREEEEWLQEQRTEAGDKIERAFGQFERREFFSAENSRADMERRKTAWLHEQNR